MDIRRIQWHEKALHDGALESAGFTIWDFSAVSQAVMKGIEAAILVDRKMDETLAVYQLSL